MTLRKCRIAGKPMFTAAQAKRLEKALAGERYLWCQYCRHFHRSTRPSLAEKP